MSDKLVLTIPVPACKNTAYLFCSNVSYFIFQHFLRRSTLQYFFKYVPAAVKSKILCDCKSQSPLRFYSSFLYDLFPYIWIHPDKWFSAKKINSKVAQNISSKGKDLFRIENLQFYFASENFCTWSKINVFNKTLPRGGIVETSARHSGTNNTSPLYSWLKIYKKTWVKIFFQL